MPEIFNEEINPEIRYIMYRKCTPAWKIPVEKMEGINLTYVVQGEARYIINNQVINVAQGNLLVLPKGYVRRAATSPEKLMHCFSVDFGLKNAQNHDMSLPFPLLSKPGHHDDIIYLYQELWFSWLDKKPGYMIKCKGLFLLILHRFLELVFEKTNTFVGDSRITKIIRHIGIHYSEHLTAKDMAEIVNLNPTYFGVLFRKVMKLSFNSYLMQTRIKNAENMLMTGEYKVGDVAEACGFTDLSHLYKQFKAVKGYPPSHSLPQKIRGSME